MALSPKYALANRAENDATVASYISGRIYEQQAPQSCARPYIIYGRVSQEHDRHLGGPSGMSKAEIQFDICDTNNEQAETIAERVRVLLDDYAGTVTIGDESVVIERVHIEDDDDDYIPADDGTDGGVFVRSLVFSVWHREAVPA